MKICVLLDDDHIFFDLQPGDKKSVLGSFVRALKGRGLISDEGKILEALVKRESLCSTGLERGIAIPHALTEEKKESFLALAVIKQGIEFEALDQMPTYVLLMLLGSVDEPGVQLKMLAHICRLVKETDVIEKIKGAASPAEVCRILEEEEARII
jgi:mannitol/fructose-specific phosphotransferase system IIA component (Ntr-type)